MWLFQTLDRVSGEQAALRRSNYNSRVAVREMERHFLHFLNRAPVSDVTEVAVAVEPSLASAGFRRMHMTLRYKFKALVKSASKVKRTFIDVLSSVGIQLHI